MDVLHWLSQNFDPKTLGAAPAIIPTVLIPLTLVTVGITSLAGMIAGWFGIKLHTEGPKQFLEVLLKKRVLISMLVVNLVGWGAYKSYTYVKNLPSFISTIEKKSMTFAVASNELYPESRFRNHDFVGKIKTTEKLSLQMVQETKLPKGAFRSGVISGNSIFFGVDDGLIYEIDKVSLKVKRKFFIGTQVTTRPIIYQNKLYAGEGSHDTHHARIYSFDLTSGSYLGSFQTKGHTEGQPVVATYKGQSLMFVTAGSDGLYAVNPEGMKEVWHKRDGHLDATVTIEEGVVFVGTGVEKGSSGDKSFAYAYDFLTGAEIWKKELPLSNWMHPVVTAHDVCFVLGEIYIASKVGALHCLNKNDGSPHFSIPFDAPIASKPFYIREGNRELVFFGDMAGTISAVDVNTREKLWSQATTKKPTKGSMTSFEYDSKNGVLWYPTNKNGLMAVNPKSGKILIHWLPDTTRPAWNKNYASVSLDNEYLYHLDIEGNLRKFKITADGPGRLADQPPVRF